MTGEAQSPKEILDFSQQEPYKPRYPRAIVHRFLTELVSSPELILDLKDEMGRKAVCVLIDKVKNPANDACLEILGLRSTEDPRPLIVTMVDWAKGVCPKGKAGIQLSLPAEEWLDQDEFLLRQDLTYDYSTYEMENSEIEERPLPRALEKTKQRKSTKSFVPRFRKIVRRIFPILKIGLRLF